MEEIDEGFVVNDCCYVMLDKCDIFGGENLKVILECVLLFW